MRPTSEQVPSAPVTAITGLSVWPTSGSGVGLTGTAVTHSPGIGVSAWWVTVPDMPPSRASVAPIRAVSAPAENVTSLAVAWGCFIFFHCGADFVLAPEYGENRARKNHW